MTDIDALDTNPIQQIQKWFIQASTNEHIPMHDAACLSTLSSDGYPNARIILVKNIDERGIIFYTNSQSQKGQELAQHPKAALTIHWPQTGQQIRIQGDISTVSDDESDRYFQSRARESQLGAWASQQSQELTSREHLLTQLEQYRQQYDGQAVPRPPHWIGYLITPKKIELWIDQAARLHDRFVYTKDPHEQWQSKRLNP